MHINIIMFLRLNISNDVPVRNLPVPDRHLRGGP